MYLNPKERYRYTIEKWKWEDVMCTIPTYIKGEPEGWEMRSKKYVHVKGKEKKKFVVRIRARDGRT